MEKLSYESINKILSNLSINDLLNLRLVNNKFKSIIDNEFEITKLTIKNNRLLDLSIVNGKLVGKLIKNFDQDHKRIIKLNNLNKFKNITFNLNNLKHLYIGRSIDCNEFNLNALGELKNLELLEFKSINCNQLNRTLALPKLIGLFFDSVHSYDSKYLSFNLPKLYILYFKKERIRFQYPKDDHFNNEELRERYRFNDLDDNMDEFINYYYLLISKIVSLNYEMTKFISPLFKLIAISFMQFTVNLKIIIFILNRLRLAIEYEINQLELNNHSRNITQMLIFVLIESLAHKNSNTFF